MNQKQVGGTIFIPQKHNSKSKPYNKENLPEDIIFDKAEEAEGIQKKKEMLADLDAKIKHDNKQLKEEKSPEQREIIEKKIEKSKELKENITEHIDAIVDKLGNTN